MMKNSLHFTDDQYLQLKMRITSVIHLGEAEYQKQVNTRIPDIGIVFKGKYNKTKYILSSQIHADTQLEWGVVKGLGSYKYLGVTVTKKNIGTENHTAVSYTHLDVYKRQDSRRGSS